MKDFVIDALKKAGIDISTVKERTINSDLVEVTLVVENRKSGRTTRKILRAIADASDGCNVVFLCHDQFAARSTFHRAMEIVVAANMPTRSIAPSQEYLRKIRIAEGSITFLSEEYFMNHDELTRGLRDVIVVSDV